MAQERPVAGGQQGGHEPPLLGEQFGRHRRIDAAVDGVQLRGAESAANR
jgi:hypothetical protein